MTIKRDGKIIERVSRNDLKNTFSVKHHKPHFVPSYKNLYLNQISTNKGLLIANGVLALLMLGIAVGCNMRVNDIKAEKAALQNELDRTLEIADDNIKSYNLLLTEYASCSAEIKSKKIVGKVSYYSHDGCIGCGENQIMANGQPFDENAMTLAIPAEWKHIKMGTLVIVKNLDNGKQMTARVTDTGGFLKYNRIADLSKGLYEAIEAVTDKSNIEITL